MRKRSITYVIVSIIALVNLLIGILAFPKQYHVYSYVLSGFLFIYAVVYLLFGLPRLIVYFIYGVVTLTIAFLIPNEYRFVLVVLMTVVVVINPLASLEAMMDARFKEGQTAMYEYPLHGKYTTYNEYRKAMKHSYHFPQTQKLYTNKVYQRIRQISVIGLFTGLIFLMIYTTNNIIKIGALTGLNIVLIYFQFILTIAVMILHKKGFTSTFRTIRSSIIPGIIYAIVLSSLPTYLKIIFGLFLGLTFIGFIITETYFYYTRVTYIPYHYTDRNTNKEVFANALYEPFIYNEDKVESHLVEIEVTKDFFQKRKEKLIVYLNYKKVLLTAYTVDKHKTYLFLEFYDVKTVEKVTTYISSLFKTSIVTKEIKDDVYYEKQFLHNHDYIIQRALSLSHILDDLEIKESLIISTAMYFKTLEEAESILKKYTFNIVDNKEGHVLLEVLITIKNVDYLIEAKLRDLLLDMLIYGGTFVRLMVYY